MTVAIKGLSKAFGAAAVLSGVELSTASMPSFASRPLTSSLAIAALASRLRRSMMARGVPFGASIMMQE